MARKKLSTKDVGYLVASDDAVELPPATTPKLEYERMDLTHYSFAPLILFRIPYTLDLLLYHLSIANGAGGVGIFNFSYFNVLHRSYRVNNKEVYILVATVTEIFLLFYRH